MPQPIHRHSKIWLILAALVLLALIPFAIQQSQKKENTEVGTNSKSPPLFGNSPSSNPTRRGRQRSSISDLPTSHSTEDLKAFFIPPSDLSQVTLEEAINSLLAQYRKICRETSEGPVQFRYTIQGNSDPIFYLKLGGDFASNCKFISAMAGMTLKIKDNHLIFTEVEDGPPVQRRWTVPPGFSSSIPHLNHTGILIDSTEEPFYEPPSIRERLLTLGAIEEDALSTYLPGSETFILRAGPKNHVKIDGLVNKAISDTSFQTRIIFTEEPSQNNQVTIPGVPNELSVLIPSGRLGFFQKNGNGDDKMPFNFLVASFERGFGREIQAVSLAGKLPSPGAQALFLETGNISDLGIGQNTLHTNAHITRESYREEYHTLTFRGGNGAQIQMPFISERIDATGRKVTIPPLNAE